VHITSCAQQLHNLTANREQDYTAAELRLVGSMVMALTTFEALSDKRQQVLDSIETILSNLLTIRIGYKPRSITHSSGYYQHYTNADFTRSSDLQPYKLGKGEESIVTDLVHVTEFTLLPSQNKIVVNGAKMTDMAYEPHLIVRNGVETHYVALTGITDIT
jgi:hypothetical protein